MTFTIPQLEQQLAQAERALVRVAEEDAGTIRRVVVEGVVEDLRGYLATARQEQAAQWFAHGAFYIAEGGRA